MLSQAQDANTTAQFTYNSVGRLTEVRNQDNKAIQYAYDTEGNVVQVTYPDNKNVTYAYDADNRLIKVTDWLNGVTEYKYDKGGRLSAAVSPGLITVYKYDAANRLTKLINYNRNTMAVQSYFEYGMDNNSNRNLIKRLLPLAGASFPTSNKGSSTYNSDNQIQTAPGRGSFTYDDNGNMLSASGTPALSFVYNPLNQLTSYTSAGSTMTFGYDVLGNRVSKTSGGSTTKYVGGLVETDAGGNITAYYVYGLGLISTIRGSTPYYYQYDGLGSTVAITNSSGTVVNSYAYDDYGQLATNATETIANPFKYVGQFGVQTDANDLLFMQARYYMPSVGRFINKDPIGLAGGVNLYGYVGGNPVKFIDPSGTFIIAAPALYGGMIATVYIIYKYGPDAIRSITEFTVYLAKKVTEGYPGQLKAKRAQCQKSYPPLLNANEEPPNLGDKDPKEDKTIWEVFSEIMTGLKDWLDNHGTF